MGIRREISANDFRDHYCNTEPENLRSQLLSAPLNDRKRPPLEVPNVDDMLKSGFTTSSSIFVLEGEKRH